MTQIRKDTEMENQKAVYVVFSKTTLGMGKFIRIITGFPYNHAGISLSPEIGKMYSFCRRYKSAPFYGGFVEESPLRFRGKTETAKIMICRVPLSEEDFSAAESRIRTLLENREDYIYNMVSAALFPFGKSVKIEKSFTCAEFVLDFLKKQAKIPELENKNFCSIRNLCEILSPYKIYEGSAEKFLSGAEWGKDTFPKKKTAGFYLSKTAETNAELLKRFIRK